MQAKWFTLIETNQQNISIRQIDINENSSIKIMIALILYLVWSSRHRRQILSCLACNCICSVTILWLSTYRFCEVIQVHAIKVEEVITCKSSDSRH